ncbi:PGAP1-like protein-domain-containing protein [Gautieria morchelliformis]|nr:PGAP1-like protein-domain-containing protein [Gautieria morchelliformis]
MARGPLPSLLLAAATVTLLATFYTSTTQSPHLLSPQGCRMSWMSPSYILQPNFNSSWTRFARRYSLWLYREEGWESPEQLSGIPVLFIPGNAGSSRQVRSIASSASHQYYQDPYKPHPEFLSSGLKPLDFFAVDFNEDFSALHGPTLLSERAYTSSAIKYILSLYPPHTQIILLGHSMGGIVALSLLPSPDISAIITMSTPHSLPPARLDKRIEDIYADSRSALYDASTPVLAICGGATDLMIPSETCAMAQDGLGVGWRKTVFTTCMEGAWTGVGHREMVWCHQVRWRVARAAMELGSAPTDAEKSAVLDRWFRDTVNHEYLAHSGLLPTNNPSVTHISANHRLVLRHVPRQSEMYLLPLVPGGARRNFILYVSHGAVDTLSPYHAPQLHVSVHRCRSSTENCRPLQPRSLKLVPNPSFGAGFPVAGEGVDESEGVVRFEAVLDSQANEASNVEEWVGVAVKGEGDRGCWVVAGIEYERVIRSDVGMFAPVWGVVSIPVDPGALTATLSMPNILSSSLVVYRVEAPKIIGACADALLPPLILHWTSSAESHFHPTDGLRPILIHTHSSGPFIAYPPAARRALNLSIYSSGECGVSRVSITLDWWSTLGAWGLRYWTTVCAWAVGVIGIVIAHAWHTWEKGDAFPDVAESLARYVTQTMAPLAGVLLLASCVPLDAGYLLGNAGEVALAPLAPLVLFVASGCVVLSWGILRCVMWGMLNAASVFGRPTAEPRAWRRSLLSLGVIMLLVSTIVPSQVAFLVCFLIHLFTCATHPPPAPALSPEADAQAQKAHVLLLLFWLLPLVAPVLAVWVRTLATAGLTTPFDGDHDVFAVASFLFFVDFASSFVAPLFDRASSR